MAKNLRESNRAGASPLGKKGRLRADALGEALWNCQSDQEAVALLGAAAIEGAALDGLDGVGQNCLAKCAMRGYEKACLALLGMGANPNAKNAHAQGALALAAVCGHLGVFKALLGAGADATEIDSDGNGIVHKIFAGEARDAKAMVLLILAVENGAIPNLANKRGVTALRMMQNVDVEEGDPRYEALRHLEALAEGRAIGFSTSPAPLATEGAQAKALRL